MINYKRVLPETLLDLGENTVFDNPDAVDNNVVKLHINIENWLGDDLLWNFPEVIVTERLRNSLESSEFTEFYFDEMEVSFDTYFEDNYQLDIPIPKFYWMKVKGVENIDDFFMKDYELYLSEKVFNFLSKNFSIKNLTVDFKSDLTNFILGLIEEDEEDDDEKS